MLTRSLCIVALLATSTPALAVDTPFGIAGIGNLTCGAYLGESDVHRRTYTFWLAGFITAENLEKGRSGGATADAAAMEAWVDEYCRTHALDMFVSAAKQLDVELDRRAKGR